jgi:hypothetical protein
MSSDVKTNYIHGAHLFNHPLKRVHTTSDGNPLPDYAVRVICRTRGEGCLDRILTKNEWRAFVDAHEAERDDVPR